MIKYRDSRRAQLWVKRTSLADEIQTIKIAESYTRRTGDGEPQHLDNGGRCIDPDCKITFTPLVYIGERDLQMYEELYEHRKDLGQMARHAHLAEAFFTGLDYATLEEHVAENNVPDFAQVEQNVRKFGVRNRGDAYEQQMIDLTEWIETARAHVKAQSKYHMRALTRNDRDARIREAQNEAAKEARKEALHTIMLEGLK